MRRWIVAALLLLCLPVVGRGQSIRYYPDSTSYTLGKTESGILYRAASANPTLLDGLVSYWPLDEISGVRYDAVGSNDLTDNNTVGSVNSGPKGVVADLAGANSEYLSKASLAEPGTVWTVSGWFKTTDGVNDAIFSFADGASETARLTIQGSVMYFIVDASNTAGDIIVNDLWYHFAAWCDGTKLYLSLNNGVAKEATDSLPAGTDLLTIGKDVSNRHHDGQMGGIGYWSVALSAAERLSLFNSGRGKRYADLTTDEKVGLVSYWNLDETSGVRYDSHGSNDLTDNNTVSSETAVPGAMNNAAASFVAANSEKLNRTGVNFGFTDFSISLWAKTPVSAAAYQEYVCKNNTIDFDLRSYDANYVQFNVNGSSAQIQTDTNWHLIVAYYVHSEKKAYLTIDAGVPTAGAAGTGLSETTSELAIGAATSSYYNNGLIDEVAIWDRVLTADERAELYNAGAGVYYPTFQ